MAGLTSIFDDIYVKQLFHKNERGETVFYPFGLIGRGYLLPKEREASIRRAMRLQMFATLIAGIAFGLLVTRISGSENPVSPVGWLVLAALFAVIFGGSLAFQFWIASGLEPMSERVQFGEWLRRGRQARPAWTYWAMIVLGIFSLLMAASGFVASVIERDASLLAAGLFFLVIAIFGIWDGRRGFIERRGAKGD
jgi:hypothetical protein